MVNDTMKTPLSRRAIVIALLTCTFLALSSPGGAASFSPPVSGAAARYVPGEVLVKFKAVASAHERAAAVADRGHSVIASLAQPGWTLVKIQTGQAVTEALAAYQGDPNVDYVQPNYIYHTTVAPDDTLYGQLWAFRNSGQPVDATIQGDGWIYPTNNPGTAGYDMDIEPAWDHITDCSSVVVAVIDTGINYLQEDLEANMWNGGAAYPNHGWNYINGNNNPMDLNGHGTHVAGIIGAVGNNARGITGVCWKASIMAVRVMDALGNGTTANISQGVNFAVSNGAKVINMSLAGSAFDPAFSDAVTKAQNDDVVVVVAAGNGGTDNDSTPVYPCNFIQPNLVCVAALDQSYSLASFSNYGAASVTVGAPGTNILSTYAGSNTTISDDFNTGGVLDWTTSGGGWAYGRRIVYGSTVDVLLDPGTYPSGYYSNNADNRVYKNFNLSGNTVAVLSFIAQFTIQPNDFLNINYRSNGGDPFAQGVHLDSLNGTNSGVIGEPFSFDISSCISASCSVGFQLLTNASGNARGVGIFNFGIATLTINSSNYNTLNGTSMASAEVSGLATMLRAYNPQYTYADVISALKGGGRATASLAGKTATGNAIDVMSSLSYINPPTGLTATVQ
jgi:thermitase